MPVLAKSTLATLAAFAIAGAATAAPANLDVARKAFSAAVAAQDLKRIVALSAFPVAVEMYRYPKSITSAAFLHDRRTFTVLFGPPDAEIVRCIESGELQQQQDRTQFEFGSWFVDCNGNEFHFASRNGQWRFVGYENINE
jgi:hypothetical protein